MFLSVGDESSTTEADTEMQLDRMRRKSGVVDLAEQLQSVEKARHLISEEEVQLNLRVWLSSHIHPPVHPKVTYHRFANHSPFITIH